MRNKIITFGIIVLAITFVMGSMTLSAKAQDDQFKIGINNFGQANFFARLGREALINAVEEHGGKALPTVTAQVPKRMNAVENYIAKGVDAIILQEGDVKQLAPALKQAKEKGIIIVSMDAGTAPFVDIVVESNNWVLGAKAASELMRRIGGKGNIVEIYNPAGQMIRMRRQILHAVLTEYSEVKITNGFVYAWPDYFPDVKAKMESVLQSQGDKIDGVFATFDGAGVAAAQAIKEAGYEDDIVVVGIDGDPEAYEEMREGDSPFKATVAQKPEEMARIVVDKVFKILNGEEVTRRHYYVPGELVTIENVPEPGKRFPGE